MANAARPTGARPWGQPLRATVYGAASTVYPGDFVQVNSSGQVAAFSSSGTSTIGVAASYQTVQGAPVVVWDHPDQQFVVGADATSSLSSALNNIGMNATITATGGSAAFKVSRMQVLANSLGTTATFPLKVLFIDPRPDNALGTYVDLVVVINNHTLKGGTGTLGL